MKKQNKKRNIIDKIVAVILLMLIPAIIYIGYLMLSKEKMVYAYTTEKNIDYELVNSPEINLDEIIQKNRKEIKKEEIIKKEKDLEYITKYTNNPDLPKGVIQVLQEGMDGKQEIVIKKTYVGDKIIKEEKVGSQVIKSSVNKMVQIGTGSYISNYEVKKGDTLYVTPAFLAVRIKAKDDAEKLITLKQNEQVKLLKKENEWYQIQYQSYIGWAKGECFTYINPNKPEKENAGSNNEFTKQQLLNKLSFDMDLSKPSGLSLEQFKKIFENESKDTQKVFSENAQYFYYAEKQYGVNGVFLAAVAIHESGWAGSSISSNKKNLFGYGAYDRDPYNSAYNFSDYSEGIDLLARVFVKYYLNKSGTKIYDGNVADGCYYNGATLSGVNVKYATDKKWANGVFYWMEYLYNRL